jgi:hypothetical protein
LSGVKLSGESLQRYKTEPIKSEMPPIKVTLEKKKGASKTESVDVPAGMTILELRKAVGGAFAHIFKRLSMLQYSLTTRAPFTLLQPLFVCTTRKLSCESRARKVLNPFPAI